MKLSAIVPATNAPPTLARCVAAIDRARDASDEVIVVTLPTDVSRWMRLDLPHRIERFTGANGAVVVQVPAGTFFQALAW